ncbi:hypothetical protein HPT29_028415 (plasmid) [Microvirga terrae]|uniref:DUF4169 family protein n=1 Tax=Microvirga terrae TaxID=2740529 RepID=A0ABY5S069_9HYPH|nr:hypothetical protein [Microvirga terrae]UVF22878.1 hypothetical protein HPT29_028415 [Microvirga terrae]
MSEQSEENNQQDEGEGTASTPQLDRLQKLANAAAARDQARQWKARQMGLGNRGEASEVRSLNHDADAKAQAEEAMQRMMAKPVKKKTRW